MKLRKMILPALAALGLLQGCASSDTSFDAVTSRLDKGGDFYLYLNADSASKDVQETVAVLKETAGTNMQDEEKRNFESFCEFLANCVRNSGASELDGIGMSSKRVDGGLYLNKIFMHHKAVPENMKSGFAWRMYGKDAHSLSSLDLLPENTVIAVFSDGDPAAFWSGLRKQADLANFDAFNKMLADSGRSEEEIMKHLQSLDGEAGIIIGFDTVKKGVFPVAGNFVEFPDTSVSLVFRVKDEVLYNSFSKLMSSKLPSVKKEKKDGILLTQMSLPVPVPAPVTFSPVVMQKDGLLVVSTNKNFAESIFDARSKGVKRLTDSAKFKTLSAPVPLYGNGFSYVGKELFEAASAIQKKQLEAAFKKDPKYAEHFNMFKNGFVFFGVFENTGDGILMTSSSDTSLAKALVVQSLVVPAAITGGMMLPALNSAREKARRISCASNLKQIGLALKQYSIDHKDTYPLQDGVAGLNVLVKDQYLTDFKVFTCPSSKEIPAVSGFMTEDHCSYVYLGGFTENDDPVTPVAFDKVENHAKKFVNVLFLDGHVEGFDGNFKSNSDVINAVLKRHNLPEKTVKELKAKTDKPSMLKSILKKIE